MQFFIAIIMRQSFEFDKIFSPIKVSFTRIYTSFMFNSKLKLCFHSSLRLGYAYRTLSFFLLKWFFKSRARGCGEWRKLELETLQEMND